MWVVAYHFWPNLGLAPPAIIAKGCLGVELFFVLSGFILCHVYLESFGRGRHLPRRRGHNCNGGGAGQGADTRGGRRRPLRGVEYDQSRRPGTPARAYSPATASIVTCQG